MWAQAVVAGSSLAISLTGNTRLRQNLAHHPNTVRDLSDTCLNGASPNCNAVASGSTTAASGYTIILLRDFLSAHNHTMDSDLLVGVRDTAFCSRMRDWNFNNAVDCR